MFILHDGPPTQRRHTIAIGDKILKESSSQAAP